MKYRPVGSTGIMVSELSLGTVKFGRNTDVKYPSSFELPSMPVLKNLLSVACELGVNLVDTAPAYGISEQRLGELLKGQRQQWIICSKAGEEYQHQTSYFDYSPSAIHQSVQRSLKRLQTDYLDILLIHSNGNDLDIIANEKLFITLNKLKEEGRIRAFGISTKTVEGGCKALALCDVIMATYNPVYTDELAVLQQAFSQKKGILIKKALASGHVDHFNQQNPVGFALDFILQQQGVSSIVVGTIKEHHLRECANYVNAIKISS